MPWFFKKMNSSAVETVYCINQKNPVPNCTNSYASLHARSSRQADGGILQFISHDQSPLALNFVWILTPQTTGASTVRSLWYSVQCIYGPVYSVLSTVQCMVQCTVHGADRVQGMIQWTMYGAVYSVWHSVFSVECNVCGVQCMRSIHSVCCSVQCSVWGSAPHSVRYSVSVQYKWYFRLPLIIIMHPNTDYIYRWRCSLHSRGEINISK